MTDSARQDVLSRIRRANRAPEDALIPPHPIPARARGDATALRARFIAMAREAGAGVDTVAAIGDVPGAVAAYLRTEGLAPTVTVAPDPALRAIDWVPLAVEDGVAPEGTVAVTAAFAAIAETGTLMVHSGPTSPNRLHFLPETHIAVVAAEVVVGGYEDAWDRLAQRFETLPRSVTLITGPSRSSDIERQLQVGVHGPRRLHIVLYDGQGH
jgi:L-lactate dehydrogenase complex protein LldG